MHQTIFLVFYHLMKKDFQEISSSKIHNKHFENKIIDLKQLNFHLILFLTICNDVAREYKKYCMKVSS